MSSLGWPLLSPFSRPIKMMKKKGNQETERARHAGVNRPFVTSSDDGHSKSFHTIKQNGKQRRSAISLDKTSLVVDF